MNFLSVDSLFKFETIKFIHLWQNGRLPGDFENFMELEPILIDILNLLGLKLSWGKCQSSFTVQGCGMTYHKTYLQEESITSVFSRKLKNHLIENQLTSNVSL